MKTTLPLRHTALPSRMRGVSMIGWIFILIAVVVFGTTAMKTIPAYMEFNTVSGTINGLLQDSKVGLLSEKEIAVRIDNQFTINNVKAIRASDLEIEKNAGTLSVKVDYEVRENLFYNLDVVVSFEREFTKSIR